LIWPNTGGALAGLLLKSCLGFAKLGEATFSGAQFGWQLIASGIAVLGILGRVDRLGLIEDGFHLCGKLCLTLGHAAISHGLVLAGVGLDLGPIESHPAEFDQPCLLAQDENLGERSSGACLSHRSRSIARLKLASRPPDAR
jgi:hypothetical protein